MTTFRIEFRSDASRAARGLAGRQAIVSFGSQMMHTTDFYATQVDASDAAQDWLANLLKAPKSFAEVTSEEADAIIAREQSTTPKTTTSAQESRPMTTTQTAAQNATRIAEARVAQIEQTAQLLETTTEQIAERFSEAQTRLLDARERLVDTITSGQRIADCILSGLLADLEAMVGEPETPTTPAPIAPEQKPAAEQPAEAPQASQEPSEAQASPEPTVSEPEAAGQPAEATITPAPETTSSSETTSPVSEEVVTTAANTGTATVEAPVAYPIAIPVGQEVPADSTESSSGESTLPELPKQWKASRMSLSDLTDLAKARDVIVPAEATKGDILRLLGYAV